MDSLLVLKDTIAAYIIKAADTSRQCIQEIPTNEYDLWIAIAICVAVSIFAIVITVGLYKWQKIRFDYLRGVDKQKNDHESARKEKEYQREKERAEWDYVKKDSSLLESLNKICDAAKDKDGKIDKDIFNLLLTNFNDERASKSLPDN